MNNLGLILTVIFQAVLLFLAAPLFSGFARVIRAKMHNRKGPPLMQNYLDIFKLMKRQEVISEQAGWIFRFAPSINMSVMILLALLIPVLTVVSPLNTAGDLILIVYLFALARFFIALAGIESGSPFGGIGARREIFISAMIEPVFLLVIMIMALLAGSLNLSTITSQVAAGKFSFSMAFWLGLAAFAFASFVEMSKLPFDIGEAEQELQEGPLAEYSGPSLALIKWSIYLKQLVLVALFLALFIPFGAMAQFSWPGLLLSLIAFFLKALLFYLVAGVIENAMARMRFVKAPAATWLALGAAVLSFVFYLANV